ncbi:hypothetical protein HY17_16640 [Hyphomonas sp. CY54-11-8]|nr:hypothetical protein HY17_16640 [Hyphomonas sp. CY54-11-8]
MQADGKRTRRARLKQRRHTAATALSAHLFFSASLIFLWRRLIATGLFFSQNFRRHKSAQAFNGG